MRFGTLRSPYVSSTSRLDPLDEVVLQYSLHVHSPLGPHLTHFSPSSSTFIPSEDPGMGIRSIAWTPGGRWIALGGFDGRVRVIESEGWRCVATLTWGPKTIEKDVVSTPSTLVIES